MHTISDLQITLPDGTRVTKWGELSGTQGIVYLYGALLGKALPKEYLPYLGDKLEVSALSGVYPLPTLVNAASAVLAQAAQLEV